ncbi:MULTISPECIES: response regulator transcription factor [Clostridium]|uniref:Stage 0 sporulation protein A homolog n=1 Tax=Clostridium cadaveris TaxID=1529 RepID=A0A1I2KM80_9CLOT|nr:response regulator transcription factor [Clostridium cadaveris]MDU4953821.1 response regulator transcription factor [Clostridium sp.]MDM8311892.1 response regulator transcription factor [Clostridium cadaveris]MDY4950016.1 response regulator transcription factor [Clostridium cadaveris]PWL55352.1 MAG: DNA-binding response regulator [Clostridium cadaveris]SFF67468.1 DNA-binding response regulator, OmpR family, contains REC and winged-helix (wHTH) domain [Clostridium cadaveris]
MEKLIYIAEDEKHIRDLEKIFLEKSGFRVETFDCGETLLKAFDDNPADLLVLDIMLPGVDGLSICNLIREKSTVPIIIVSAKDSEMDKITGITIGSDDYLTKPFSPIELVVRVQAIFRRIEMHSNSLRNDDMLTYGDLVVNKKRREITKDGTPISLTPTEYKVITYLIDNADKAISRDELLRNIWEFDIKVIDTRATDDTMKRLRKKLVDIASSVKIETIRGYGFRIGFDKNE